MVVVIVLLAATLVALRLSVAPAALTRHSTLPAGDDTGTLRVHTVHGELMVTVPMVAVVPVAQSTPAASNVTCSENVAVNCAGLRFDGVDPTRSNEVMVGRISEKRVSELKLRPCAY